MNEALSRVGLGSAGVPRFVSEVLARPYFLNELSCAHSVIEAFTGVNGRSGSSVGDYLHEIMPEVDVDLEAANSLVGEEDDDYPAGVTDTGFVKRLLRLHGLMTAENLTGVIWSIVTDGGDDFGPTAAAIYLMQESPEAQTAVIGSLKGASYRWAVEAMLAAGKAQFSEWTTLALAADMASRAGESASSTRETVAGYLAAPLFDNFAEFRSSPDRRALIAAVQSRLVASAGASGGVPDWFHNWAHLFESPDVSAIGFAEERLEDPNSFIGWEAAAALRRESAHLGDGGRASIEHAAYGSNAEAVCRALWVLGSIPHAWAEPLVERSLSSSDLFISAAARRATSERASASSAVISPRQGSTARPGLAAVTPVPQLRGPMTSLSDLMEAGLVLPGDSLVREHPSGAQMLVEIVDRDKFRAGGTKNCKPSYEEAAQRFIRDKKLKPMKKVGGLAFWTLKIGDRETIKLREIAEQGVRP